jgi:hypothetical protein
MGNMVFGGEDTKASKSACGAAVATESTDAGAIEAEDSSFAILPQGLSTVSVEGRYAFTRFLYRIRKQYHSKLHFLQAMFIQFEFGPHLPLTLTLTGNHDNISIGPTNGTDMGPWSYTGEALNGLRHGVGTCTWPSADRKGATTYSGAWKEGLPHGACRVTSARGYVYEGTHRNGTKQGKGKYMYATGDVYEVEYDEQGKVLSGNDKMTFANGVVVVGFSKSLN